MQNDYELSLFQNHNTKTNKIWNLHVLQIFWGGEEGE